jgi:hypothetical protein
LDLRKFGHPAMLAPGPLRFRGSISEHHVAVFPPVMDAHGGAKRHVLLAGADRCAARGAGA